MKVVRVRFRPSTCLTVHSPSTINQVLFTFVPPPPPTHGHAGETGVLVLKTKARFAREMKW